MTSVVALLLFDGCDVMDVTGPYEVLLAASRLTVRDGLDPLVEVRTVSVDGDGVIGYGGLGLVPSHGALGDQTDLDVVVVPGLIDVAAGVADASLVDAIRNASTATPLTMSVCTGAFLLDAAGVTTGRPVTTHWEDVADLRARRRAGGDHAEVREAVRWVDDGDVLTAGGISSGVDAALHLVARLADHHLAERTARQIDHVWDERA